MRIQFFSDIHLETRPKKAPFVLDVMETDPDVVVLAGDIVHGGVRAIEWAKVCFPGRPVVVIRGNHESYDHNIESVERKMRLACEAVDNVYFLESDEVIIDGVRFLGTPLWTDFKLFGEDRREEAMRAAIDPDPYKALKDYRLIRLEAGGYRRLRPSDTARFHAQQRSWLAAKLGEPFVGSTVVVTHMAPSIRSIPVQYANDILSAAYASNLDHLIEKATLWIHGHIHERLDYRVGDKGRVVCNPLGYTNNKTLETENEEFDLKFIVEVPN
jgi:predicted phosphodiesterase